MALCNTGVLLQLSCKRLDDGDLTRVGTWTPKVEWGALHGSYQHFLTLCVSLPKEGGGGRGEVEIRGQMSASSFSWLS